MNPLSPQARSGYQTGLRLVYLGILIPVLLKVTLGLLFFIIVSQVDAERFQSFLQRAPFWIVVVGIIGLGAVLRVVGGIMCLGPARITGGKAWLGCAILGELVVGLGTLGFDVPWLLHLNGIAWLLAGVCFAMFLVRSAEGQHEIRHAERARLVVKLLVVAAGLELAVNLGDSLEADPLLLGLWQGFLSVLAVVVNLFAFFMLVNLIRSMAISPADGDLSASRNDASQEYGATHLS